MKVPLKDAIETGDWLSCCYKISDEEHKFRFKALSMTRINIDEIDDFNKTNIDGGVLWLLRIEVVNMDKVQCFGCDIRNQIAIFDSDDFLFLPVRDDHLTSHSKFAVSSGLYRFTGWSNCPPLQPKIKASGAIAYLLPEEDTEYFLSVKDGEISEA
jgi:hypothetical protein